MHFCGKNKTPYWSVIVLIVWIAVVSLVVMLLWNWIGGSLFHLPFLDWPRALGLLILVRLLLGHHFFFRNGGWGHRQHFQRGGESHAYRSGYSFDRMKGDRDDNLKNWEDFCHQQANNPRTFSKWHRLWFLFRQHWDLWDYDRRMHFLSEDLGIKRNSQEAENDVSPHHEAQ